jgi:hypothetical protein
VLERPVREEGEPGEELPGELAASPAEAGDEEAAVAVDAEAGLTARPARPVRAGVGAGVAASQGSRR